MAIVWSFLGQREILPPVRQRWATGLNDGGPTVDKNGRQVTNVDTHNLTHNNVGKTMAMKLHVKILTIQIYKYMYILEKKW